MIPVEQAEQLIRAGLALCFMQIHGACGDIRSTECDGLSLAPDCREVVAVGFVQHTGFDQRAGRHHADDPALDQSLGERRILHLLADRDTVAEIHELFEILFCRMIRHAAHRRPCRQTAVASGECQLQQLRDKDRIVKEHLIEVAEPEKYDRIPRSVLDRKILLHHRGEL